MSKVIRIHKADALYLDARDVPSSLEQAITERYTVRFYNEKACADCEHAVLRHSEEFCNPCPAFTDEVHLSGRYTIGKRDYIKAPLGDQARLIGYLHSKGFSPKTSDHQTNGKRYPLKFIGKLRDYQRGSDIALIRARRGVLKARPRTGKTVMATAAICRIGKKTLIVAAQREWLQGFYDTFVGSKLTKRMTNVPKSRIGFCKTYKDFEHNVICLATYQTFLSPEGRKLLERIRGLFTTIVVDECFPADTLVTTNLGKIPIHEVASNPNKYKALSFNHHDNIWEFQPVVQGFVKSTRKKLLRITLEDGTTITCTEDHKIWSEDRNQYIKASELTLASILKKPD